ncbi:hypothetical protein ABTX81_34650 [Kitasatospora sp. NPDC097605]|uniref:hypothetical protein n=1 Tax=Kitasatospora sp. NPDC097605 TaxID=3157226 RepID=UPI0033342970
MDTRQDSLRRDLEATVQARKELGKEYESELLDSFLSRLDARLDARVERRVSERLGPADGYGHPDGAGRPYGRPGYGRRSHRSGIRLPIVSMVLGIPLSAISGSVAGFWGLLVCWGGIVGVNVSASLAERVEEKRRPAEPRSDWD